MKNRTHHHLAAAAVALATVLAGCANMNMSTPAAPPAPPPPPPVGEVPAAVRAPQGQSVFLEAFASGVQIYECAPKADAPGGFAWVFRAPEAALTDRAGKTIGKHYAGPTWESVDGSTAAGTVTASDPGPDKAAIPWLLLSVKSSSGAGVLTQTKSIQRLQTQGGAMPAQPCAAASAKQVARVPYRATYYFFRPGP